MKITKLLFSVRNPRNRRNIDVDRLSLARGNLGMPQVKMLVTTAPQVVAPARRCDWKKAAATYPRGSLVMEIWHTKTDDRYDSLAEISLWHSRNFRDRLIAFQEQWIYASGLTTHEHNHPINPFNFRGPCGWGLSFRKRSHRLCFLLHSRNGGRSAEAS